MKVIEPHIHLLCRTTDDYDRLFQSGVVAVTEPAFWAGFDRGSPEAFEVYFRQITTYERLRAARHGIDYYCWLCLNPKEAEDLGLAREVMGLIPEYYQRDNVLGIGEIGLNKNSRNELKILEEHIALAAELDALILVHTPHLEDKLKGTRLIIDAIKAEPRIAPHRVLIDHMEEHTVHLPRAAGMWCGLTLYPETKCTPARAADIIERWGSEQIWINSAADWGPSDPFAVLAFIGEMLHRGHDRDLIEHIVYDNPARFLSQSPRFRWKPRSPRS
jgi:predicted metal-dependent TIM-barrel fold hydrolase